ncbi:LLM class flavin-dependent oxidoreductase [Sciscionella sediminilitoris]|uniref:LLM class flavin-dependent oxidoreductase n=1 Tax=Sciscionella sediminilitoris TaxID=1445613 RepID=UPI0004DF90FC|nr:LLM class flavin-dependent oxidoreductase [Sciscionella sp. SE31]
MRFTCALAMNPPEQLVPLAIAAEQNGFSSIALPDSIFAPEKVNAVYPYTPDGKRVFTPETPFVDPLIAASAIGAATTTIRCYSHVVKLGSRHPVPFARQVGTVANLTGNRFGLGLGIGWQQDECRWCGIESGGLKGKRTDEAIEVIQLLLGGGMVEHHGEYFDFERIQMSPAPSEPVPVYVGGHTEPALRRAARHDGWTTAMIKMAELREIIARLRELRAENGREHEPFEIQAVCVDRFGLDGYREQAEAGVTDAITVPWLFYGVGFEAPVEEKQDCIKRFAEEYIAPLEAVHG